MNERKLGKDLSVSEIGLGTMGMSYAYGEIPDKAQMVKVLRESVELGERFLILQKCMDHSPMRNCWEKL
ncbi:hypothetical protein GQR36_03290 [Enterococcus termitis]